MYYEEKMIDGVLYYRTNPRDIWTPKNASVSLPTPSAPATSKFNRDQMAWEIYRDRAEVGVFMGADAYMFVDYFLAEVAKQQGKAAST